MVKFASMEPEDRVDPMSKVFPKMTKCSFHKYGGSGTLQLVDALCVLGMNVLNEKIYIFLWFWYLILALITGVSLLTRLVQLMCPGSRNRYIQQIECWLKKTRITLSSPSLAILSRLLCKFIGDWHNSWVRSHWAIVGSA